MEIVIIVTSIIGIISVCYIGNRIVKVLTEINTNLNAFHNELKKTGSFHEMDLNLINITRGLEIIASAIVAKSPIHESKPESEPKPDWQIENEARKELHSILGSASQDEFTEFLSTRYHLSRKDPWISKISKILSSIGLEPAITEIRNRDKSHQVDLKTL